jgi:5-methylcytosine-specific restriction enzyme subunit McrC
VLTALVELTEYEAADIDDDIVDVVPASFWAELGVTVTRLPGAASWRARPDALAGIARYVQPGVDLTVVIRPKLSGADTLFLAEHAFGQKVDALRRPQGGRVGLDNTYLDPVAALLMWYVRTVSDFATRWLRRSYRSRRVTLHAEIRGRLLVSQYVTNSLATGRLVDVPSVVTERTVDTPNNRVLKAGLRQVSKLSAALPSLTARRAVHAAVNAALPRFADVSDVPIRPPVLRQTRTVGPERHYATVLRATIDLLSGRYLSSELGSTVTDSFLWSMPVLFQEALRGILAESDRWSLDVLRPSAQIYDSRGRRLRSSRIDPDYVLQTLSGPVLLDAKYKEALRLQPFVDDLVFGDGGPIVTVSRHDIYQMSAYRQHQRWLGAPSALVYPVVLRDGVDLPPSYEVHGFGAPIQLMFIDVGPTARSNIAAFLHSLDALATRVS